MKYSTTTISAPSLWASAITNGDFSGLDDEESSRCHAWLARMAADGLVVTGPENGAEPSFTWLYQLYDAGSPYRGGQILSYMVLVPDGNNV